MLNREVSLRQISFMFLFISLSQMFRQIPNVLAETAGRSSYLSPLWAIAAMLPLTGLLIVLIKSFPGLNLYEIMTQLMGVFLAKVVMIGYLMWLLIGITIKLNAYSLTMQLTLMPQTRNDFFMIIMLLLVYYALFRGMKTIFRFAEFSIGPILIFLLVLFICAFSQLRTDYLIPVSFTKIPDTLMASKHVIAVGGNLIIVLFFGDKLGISLTKHQFRKLWMGVVEFIGLSFLITLFTVGISGASLTSNLPFPFYITVKSISFFNVLERFEVLITLLCILSDFASICLFAILILRCFEWIFHLKHSGFLAVPLTIIIYYLTFYITRTQFEFDYFYRTIIVNLNLIFQYIIPFLLAFLCLVRRKKIQKQY